MLSLMPVSGKTSFQTVNVTGFSYELYAWWQE